MSVVAYQGEVEFDGAFWDEQSGFRIRWRIVGTPGLQDKANPMKKFTKRRGDRSGTRFMAAFRPVAFGQPFDGEVMLAAWSDSTAGWSVTFEQEDPAFVRGCLRRTKDRPGTRFMAVLAEIDHDENVIDQQQRERVEAAQRNGKGALLLSNRAALLIKSPQFHEFLRETVQSTDWNADAANDWLKTYLGIDSKADLDDKRNERARGAYLRLLEQWEDWRNGN